LEESTVKRLVITLGLLLLAGQARAADPVNLELWQQQARINQLMQKRVTHLETRVAELERRVGTGYTPGSPPPAPSYTPPPTYAPTYAAATGSGGGYSGASGSATSPPLPAYYK
jgi:hypothetical protein